MTQSSPPRMKIAGLFSVDYPSRTHPRWAHNKAELPRSSHLIPVEGGNVIQQSCRCHQVATVNQPEGVRRWLHLQPGWQRPAGRACRARQPLAACLLSPAVAGGATLGPAARALQPFEKKPRRKNSAGWHPFCLLLEYRPPRGDDR